MSIAVLLSSFKVCTSANESQSLGDGELNFQAEKSCWTCDKCANSTWRMAA